MNTGCIASTMLALVASLAACDYNKKEVELAKHSLYDTDFALVYSLALDSTRRLYPNLDDNPGSGKIMTAWHQVQFANTEDDLSNQATVAAGSGAGGGSSSQQSAGTPTRLAMKRMFVRFDVSVIGGRPWRVRVVGHAAEWDPGAAMPTELKGIAKPPWLGPRTDSLQRDIYKRLAAYAVPVKETPEPVDPHMPVADPSKFKSLPPAAASLLAGLRVVLLRRSYDELRPLLAPDIVWGDGGGNGRDGAMAIWQADPTLLAAMAATLDTCELAGTRVRCHTDDFELLVELRDRAWKLAAFIRIAA